MIKFSKFHILTFLPFFSHTVLQSYGLTILRSYGLIYITVLFFLSSCIEPFEPIGVKDSAGILVVEGIIVEQGTTIKLSRTVRLNEKLYDASRPNLTKVDNAVIHIIDEANNVIATAVPQIINEVLTPGTYVINEPITFTPGMKYALDMIVDKTYYRSAFVSPVLTPEIDEVSWTLNDDKIIDIMVSTHDPTNEIKYYRWAFEEDWEVRAPLFATRRYDPQSRLIIEQNINTPNNRYYCWGSAVSKSILLSTTDRLTESVIKNKIIHRISASDRRFSYLYTILVKQYGLDKEAYTYFENVRRNAENGGSIFGIQPTEIKGNIQCVSYPHINVIGYVAIAKETISRIYINSTGLYIPESDCNSDRFETMATHEISTLYDYGWGIFQYDYNNNVYLGISRKCVDCTELGGTKNKPVFWPNDHQ